MIPIGRAESLGPGLLGLSGNLGKDEMNGMVSMMDGAMAIAGDGGDAETWPPQQVLEGIRQILETARRGAIARERPGKRICHGTKKVRPRGGSLQASDRTRIDLALERVVGISRLYHEALVEQNRSIRVRAMVEDLQGLQDLLIGLGEGPLSVSDEEKVWARIKSLHFETRAWVAVLPLQSGAKNLPAGDGRTQEERAGRLNMLWKSTEAAWFAPPNQSASHLRHLNGERGISDPMDGLLLESGVGHRRWSCNQQDLAELMAFAREALLIEVEGPDRGGRTTFSQRRLGTRPKDSFAMGCVMVYEETVGLNTAKQSNAERRSMGPEARTKFEKFCCLVSDLAVGPDAKPEWRIGLAPFRQAIATSRAWLALYKAAGCKDAGSFDALSLDDKVLARQALPVKVRSHLVPEAPPWA
jgi:hypothetical protein